MTRHGLGRRIVPAALAGSAILLALLAGSMASATARAQAPVDPIEPDDAAVADGVPRLQRVVVAEQDVVLWLPETFSAGRKNSQYRRYEDPDSGLVVVLAHAPTTPGISLRHLWDQLEEQSGEDLREVLSVEETDVMDRPAIAGEVVFDLSDDLMYSTMLVTHRSDEPRHRRISVNAAEKDSVLRRNLADAVRRDWWVGDEGVWTLGFETERRRAERTLSDREPVDWASRNAAFLEIATASGPVDPTVDVALLEQARANPMAAVDGLVHPHERVRIWSVEAIASLDMDGGVRDRLLAFAMRDPDPAVRLSAARTVSAHADPGRVAARLALGDDEQARSGLLQLVAVLDGEARRGVLDSLVTSRRDMPATTLALFHAMVGRWGAPATLDRLASGLPRLRSEEARAALVGALLGRRHERGTEFALSRLERPSTSDVLTVEEARDYLLGLDPGTIPAERVERVVEAMKGDEEDPVAALVWSSVAKSLRNLADDGSVEAQGPGMADGCVRFADSLQRDLEPWEEDLWRSMGCDEEVVRTRILSVVAPRSGQLSEWLIGMASGLALESEDDRRLYAILVDAMFDSLADDGPGGSSLEATGLDLGAAWRTFGDQVSLNGRRGTDVEDLDYIIHIPSASPMQLAERLVQSAESTFALHDFIRMAPAVAAATSIMPVMLAMVRDEVVDDVNDSGSPAGSGESASPVEALTALERVSGTVGEVWELVEVALFDTRIPSWDVQLGLVLEDDAVLLTTRRPRGRLEVPGDTVTRSDVLVFAEIDLDEWTAVDDEITNPLEGFGGTLLASVSGDDDGVSTAVHYGAGTPEHDALFIDRSHDAFRMPHDLLPAATVAWFGAFVDTDRAAHLMRELVLDAVDDEDPEITERLIGAVESSTGELGFALLSVPGAEITEDEAWLTTSVFAMAAGPKEGRRFLKSASEGSRRWDGGRIYDLEDAWGALVGDYLVIVWDPDILPSLVGGDDALARSPHFDDVVRGRSPEEIAFLGFIDTDRAADQVHELTADLEDPGFVRLAIEALRALGPVVSWARNDEEGLRGAVGIRPAFVGDLPAMEADRRFTASSVPVTGLDPTTPEVLVEQVVVALEGAHAETAVDTDRERIEVVERREGRVVLRVDRGSRLPEAADVAEGSTADELRRFLRDEPELDIEGESITRVADEIRNRASNPADRVRAVVDWVQSNLEYEMTKGTEAAERTLRSRRADCTEFSNLTIALCRALGIPARRVGGISLSSDVGILHRWVEVHLGNWYEIDPTFGVTWVPALSVPLDAPSGLALVQADSHRFDVVEVGLAEGGIVRRLAPPADEGASEQVHVRAAGRTVVVVETMADGDAAVWVTRDEGGSFIQIPVPRVPLGSLVALDDRILWHGIDDGGGHRMFELAEDDSWFAHGFPDLPHGPAGWSLATMDGGLLAIPVDAAMPWMLLDAAGEGWSETLPPPEGRHPVISASGRYLAVDDPDEGIVLYEREADDWERITGFADDADLQPTRLSVSPGQVAISCWDRRREVSAVLWWSPVSGDSNRIAGSPDTRSRDVVVQGDWGWRAWRGPTGLMFARVPAME
jgi:hypothetical protein